MKNSASMLSRIGLLGIVLGLFCSGCNRSSEPLSAVDASEAPAAIESAFDGATPEVRQAASGVVDALKANDPATAFLGLQSLSERSDLTDEQRQAAAQSLAAIGKELNDAAARGDLKAQEVLEVHRARK